MKFPSLKLLTQNASATFLRFPFTLVSAALATLAVITLIQNNEQLPETVFIKLLMAAALGLALFTAQAAFAEKQHWSQARSFVFQGIGVTLLLAYFFSLPEDMHNAPEMHGFRFLLFCLGAHFLVAFLPFSGKDEVAGFWQFNKTLFLRFLTAVLYSGVLFVGLVIALQAVEHLFGLQVAGKRYAQLWVIIAGLFNTWFFLAGIPQDLESLNRSNDYPRGLKIFTQYILLPLVVLYLAILYAYEAKIILNWSWPKGWVAQLVLWFSVSGILSVLLLYPIKDSEKNRWVQTFSTWFFRALIPLVIMLVLAIFRRISDYGITENRYFVLVLAFALIVVVLYFVFSRVRDIRIIPAILCCLAFLVSFGPWGAFSVSRTSQKNRLEALLHEHKILVNGKVQKAPGEVPFEARRKISSSVVYLNSKHGFNSMDSWFTGDFKNSDTDSTAHKNKYEKVSDIMALMGISYVERWQTEEARDFYLNADANETLPIAGYEYFIRSQALNSGLSTKIGRDSFNISFDSSRSAIKLSIITPTSVATSKEIVLQEMVSALLLDYGDQPIPQDSLTLSGVLADYRFKLIISTISGRNKPGGIRIEDVHLGLLLGKRN